MLKQADEYTFHDRRAAAEEQKASESPDPASRRFIVIWRHCIKLAAAGLNSLNQFPRAHRTEERSSIAPIKRRRGRSPYAMWAEWRARKDSNL